MNNYDKLFKIVDKLNEKFDKNQSAFQIIARLCEEAGELAQKVNHMERTGLKIEKYGEPNKEQLAKEAQDVIRAVLSIVRHYHIEKEFEMSLDKSLEKLSSE